MLNVLKKFGSLVLLILATSTIVAVGAYLFFGEQVSFYLESKQLLNQKLVTRDESEVLRIGYVFAPQSLKPIHFDPTTRNFLVDIYEGLVKTDKNLNIQSGLAVSWGMLQPDLWEFRLRPNVKFHDGSNLDAEDVLYSLELARTSPDSQLKDLLNTIESVDFLEQGLIHLKLRIPDPLILSKLALVYIVPAGYEDFENPVGTGPYSFDSFDGEVMALNSNKEYWGNLPAFSQVELKAIRDRRDRIDALEKGELDILANMPPSSACSFEESYKNSEDCSEIKVKDLQIKSIPSLEVSFLLFNFDNEILKDRKFREVISKVFDRQVFVDMAFGFSKPANQFVSSGVFGFDPGITGIDYDLEGAKTEFGRIFGNSFSRITLTFDYPASLETIGQYVKAQFYELGIDVQLNPLDDLALQKKIQNGDSDLYFLGWRSELGDAGDFLQSVVHTKDLNRVYGIYNGMNYSNQSVDMLIEDSQKNIETENRLSQLQEVSRIIIEEDIVGIPLFESETVFAYSNKITFEPRVDGFISSAEIK